MDPRGLSATVFQQTPLRDFTKDIDITEDRWNKKVKEIEQASGVSGDYLKGIKNPYHQKYFQDQVAPAIKEAWSAYARGEISRNEAQKFTDNGIVLIGLMNREEDKAIESNKDYKKVEEAGVVISPEQKLQYEEYQRTNNQMPDFSISTETGFSIGGKPMMEHFNSRQRYVAPEEKAYNPLEKGAQIYGKAAIVYEEGTDRVKEFDEQKYRENIDLMLKVNSPAATQDFYRYLRGNSVLAGQGDEVIFNALQDPDLAKRFKQEYSDWATSIQKNAASESRTSSRDGDSGSTLNKAKTKVTPFSDGALNFQGPQEVDATDRGFSINKPVSFQYNNIGDGQGKAIAVYEDANGDLRLYFSYKERTFTKTGKDIVDTRVGSLNLDEDVNTARAVKAALGVPAENSLRDLLPEAPAVMETELPIAKPRRPGAPENEIQQPATQETEVEEVALTETGDTIPIIEGLTPVGVEVQEQTEVEEATPEEPAQEPSDAAEEDVKAKEEVTKVVEREIESPSVETPQTDIKTKKGELPMPVEGEVSSKFGKQRHPLSDSVTIDNKGIDITTAPNTDIKPVEEGTVSGVMRLPNGTVAIIVDHGGIRTVYHNVQNISVKKGDKVSPNTPIGQAYTNPNTDQTVVHFEVWDGNNAVNPASWLASK